MEWFDGTTVRNVAQRRNPTPLAGIIKDPQARRRAIVAG
jgi:hypothetical protein